MFLFFSTTNHKSCQNHAVSKHATSSSHWSVIWNQNKFVSMTSKLKSFSTISKTWSNALKEKKKNKCVQNFKKTNQTQKKKRIKVSGFAAPPCAGTYLWTTDGMRAWMIIIIMSLAVISRSHLHYFVDTMWCSRCLLFARVLVVL